MGNLRKNICIIMTWLLCLQLTLPTWAAGDNAYATNETTASYNAAVLDGNDLPYMPAPGGNNTSDETVSGSDGSSDETVSGSDSSSDETVSGGNSSQDETVSDGDGSQDVIVEAPTIINLENIEYLTNLPAIDILQGNSQDLTPVYYFVFTLRSVNAQVLLPDGTSENLSLSVDWQCMHFESQHIDTTTVGTYTETGTLLLPSEEYVWGEGIPQTLTVPINVYVPEEPYIIMDMQLWDNNYDSAYAVEPGEDISYITDSCRTTWPCYDAEGNEYLASISWDASAVDTQTVGLYHIIGEMQPPLHCEFDEGLELPTLSVPVSVQAPGQPDINCFTIKYGYITFPWVEPDCNVESMQPWLAQKDGEWVALSEEDEVYWDEYSLMLPTWLLTENTEYRLQVDYEGGQTGILTFTYISENLAVTEDYVHGDRDGGDTEGNLGSNAPDTLPTAAPVTPVPTDTPATQEPTGTPATEAPVPTQAPAETPTATTPVPTQAPAETPTATTPAPTQAPMETPATATPVSTQAPAEIPVATPTVMPTVTPTTDTPAQESTMAQVATPTPAATEVPTQAPDSEATSEPVEVTPEPTEAPADRAEPYLLGSELRMMLDSNGFARFSEEGISLTCTQESLEDLQIQDSDRFLVTITKTATNSFTVDITLNGTPITELPGMQLMVPYVAATMSPTLSLSDANGQLVAEGTYHFDQKLAVFKLDETGQFTIVEERSTLPASTTDTETTSFPLWPIACVGVCFLVCILLIYLYKRRRNLR